VEGAQEIRNFNVKSQNVFFYSFLTSYNPLKTSVSIVPPALTH
jgi:hypothetical protein